jgi:hypothetical protein
MIYANRKYYFDTIPLQQKIRMRYLFVLMFLNSFLLFSQSQVNLGLGAGQQFGFPGIRAGYMWNKLEGSANFGLLSGIDSKTIPKNYSKIDAMHYCMGFGLTFFLKRSYSISYNFGTVFFKSSDGYIISTELQNLHTLCLNNELLFKKVRWRFGYGIGYSNEYETDFNKFYPVLSLGCIFKIWEKEKDSGY